MDRKVDLWAGLEKEYKWLRDFQIESYLYPQLLTIHKLTPWQTLGIQFLYFYHRYYGFILLTDEMGVGKIDTSFW